ncbi:hypothetical protein ACE5D9_07315 [Rickettsia sp. 2024-CO-Wats]|uniref:hypothetical protein n=1 Tax=unclassified Rickettsia TaxID=114295 RepID=UPI003C738DDD
MSKSGHTITLDFGIGNKNFLGQGLASSTLAAFIKFYHKYIDPLSDTFFIDPDENKPRAIRLPRLNTAQKLSIVFVDTDSLIYLPNCKLPIHQIK